MVDEIKELISLMEELAGRQQYEDAQHVLNSIKNELKKEETVDDKEFLDRILSGKTKEPTILGTYRAVIGHSVRLNPDIYRFSDFLGLLSNVTDRLKQTRRFNEDVLRRIVAEEMLCSKMSVPLSYKGIKPNRAFLDIAYKVHPDICKHELERREKVMLWKAIESGSREKIEEAKKKVFEYRK